MNNYSFLQKLFHKIILNNDHFLNISYDLEKFFSKKDLKNSVSKKLFITGYARSGTTILLNNLYQTGQFKSLTYNDMPFILSPKINKFFKLFRNSNKSINRAHGDEIKIGNNSPEAFEEVFWKNRFRNEYVKDTYLEKNDISDYLLEEFSYFINSINLENKIYLSKNNNNILRIEKITDLAESLILILFRKPEFQSVSLLNQHNNFCNLQKKDKFILDYMSSIGHYEFGNNHKVFFNEKIFNDDLSDGNYWLYQWIKVYEYLLEFKKKNMDRKNLFFLSYEECAENIKVVENKVNNFFGTEINMEKIKNKNEENSISQVSFDKNLINHANKIYLEMDKYSFIK